MLTEAERAALLAENAAWIARQAGRNAFAPVPRRKGCLKRGFKSAAAAREDAKDAKFRIRAYRCDDHGCGLYHVTNQDKRT